MLTSCRAEHTGFGIILSGIDGRQKAERLRNFFAKEGLPAIITPFASHDSYRVVLIGTTLDEFHRVADRAEFEVDQKKKDVTRSL